MNTTQIVRAIDLGYGYVKYTARNRQSDSPPLVQCAFPSMALPGASAASRHDIEGLRAPKILPVVVREMSYIVGPDTPLLLAGQTGRALGPDYSRSTIYEALMLGALAYIGEHAIDYLVLGLPVSRYDQERKRLQSLYSGNLNTPMPGEQERTQSTEVKNVIVVPQPVGGFVASKAEAEDGGKSWRGATLVIDPGYFTFDWVVVSESNAYVASRSGAVHGGMSQIIRAIADQIEHETGLHINNTHPIDTAIRSGDSVHFGPHEIPIVKYRGVIESRAKAYVADMVGRLGERNDIRRVVLCGGGAKLIRNAIEDALPAWEVIVARDSAYANLRGFQMIGESIGRLAVAA